MNKKINAVKKSKNKKTYSIEESLKIMREVWEAIRDVYSDAGNLNKIYPSEHFHDLARLCEDIRLGNEKFSEPSSIAYQFSVINRCLNYACSIRDSFEMMNCMLDAAKACEAVIEFILEIEQSSGLKLFKRE